MQRLRAVGHATGHYMGNGQGDIEDDDSVSPAISEVRLHEDISESVINTEQDADSAVSQPLLFFYDCETTGLSIYDDHITEIAAKPIGISGFSVNMPSFSSLVHTPRNIPRKGL